VAEPCPGAISGVQDGVVSVTVEYDAPIFIPVLGSLLSTPGRNDRQIIKTITTRVEPCPITRGS
jgi:hypothetical protein